MNKKIKGTSMYILIMAMLVLLVWAWTGGMQEETKELEYSEIIGYFQNLQVKEFKLNLGTGELNLVFTEESGLQKQKTKLSALEPFLRAVVYDKADGSPTLVDQYNEKHPNEPMRYDLVPPSAFQRLSAELLPLIIMIGLLVLFFVFMMRQTKGGAGGVMNFGKAKARMPDDMSRVTFADVAGADEEKEELVEIVEFLKAPSKFNQLGARIPKGVLLMGPPGTGKTLLAKAVAGEAGVPFFSISGSDFVEMFVGVGASRVRDLFEQAKKNAPAIIFIDEIDAVGRHRGAGLGGGHDEREQTLNQLLVEMDGFGTNSGVIIIAATNRRDILDPALLRPGRFDRQIVVNYPDIKGREEILRVHTRNKPIAPDVNLRSIAASTVGFTGADLENLANEAALLAARRGLKAITMTEIEEATMKVIVGPEKRSHVVTDKEKKLTAYHEAGHAICTYYLPTQDTVHQISIIPRGLAGGYTLALPTEDKKYRTKKEMQESLVVLLGGRVAEKLVLEDISTGASNDIDRATKLVRDMITRYGFSEKLGPIVYGGDQHEVFLGRDFSSNPSYSENVAAEIDAEIREIIDASYEKARTILEDHIDQLHLVAHFLYDNEKVEENEFAALMKGEPVPDYPDFDLSPRTEIQIAEKSASKQKNAAAEEPAPEPQVSEPETEPAANTEAEEAAPPKDSFWEDA